VDVAGLILENDSCLDDSYVYSLLNSDFLTYQLNKPSAPFKGGFYSCNKQFLGKIVKVPMTDEETILSQRIVSLTQKILQF
jgi:hypothetical protein